MGILSRYRQNATSNSGINRYILELLFWQQLVLFCFQGCIIFMFKEKLVVHYVQVGMGKPKER